MMRCLLLFLLFSAASINAQLQCSNPVVLLSVSDPNGNMVRGLGPQHLRAKLGKHPTVIESVSPIAAPIRVLILLDQGLIGEGEKWPATHQLLANLVRYARPDTSFALEVYGKGPEVHVPFGESRDVILKKLDGLDTDQRHAGKITDGVIHSLKLFGTHQKGDVLFAITDGLDDASHANASAIQRAVLSSGVRLFAIYFREPKMGSGAGVVVSGPVPGAPSIQPWDPNVDSTGIVDAVNQSGGVYVSVQPAVASRRFELFGKRLEELEKRSALTYRAMSQPYVLRLKGPVAVGTPFEVSMEDEKLSALTLVYPKKIEICEVK